MPRETFTFNGDELRDDPVGRFFNDAVQQAMEQILADAEKTDWFTELCLYVPVNQHGVDQPLLYLGIDPDEDESGVETYDVLDKVKANEYPGLSYKYFDEDTPVGLAMVLGPSHIPNGELDTADLV